MDTSFVMSFNKVLETPVDINIGDVDICRERLLAEALCSMASVRDSITGFPALRDAADDMVTFLQSLHSQTNNHRRLDSESLKQLRHMLLRLPNQFIPVLNAHPAAMLLMAHLHAIVVFIEPMKVSSCAGFYSLHAAPIQAFYEEIHMRADLESRSSGTTEYSDQYQRALKQMGFPIRVIRAFRWKLSQGQQGLVETEASVPRFRSNTLSGGQQTSMLQTMEDFPVGLWHNFVCN